MTNREFILNCIQGMSDSKLRLLWETLFEYSGVPMPCVSACEACEAEHGECTFEHPSQCSEAGAAWMKREVVLRSG